MPEGGEWPADAPAPAIAPFDEEQARKHQQAWADYLKLPLEFTNSVGMKFILIPPGEFLMGSTPEEIEELLKEWQEHLGDAQEHIRSEAPRHKVVLTQPIYLGVDEVTQREYEAVMGNNPSLFAGEWAKARGIDTANHPLENVTWNDAAEYCAKLSKQEELKPFYFRTGETVTPLKGSGYRLPTEAEWEFARRAGTTTKFWNGDESPVGWFANNADLRTHVVEELPENPFGLYDVHGNVWEWVEDGWEPGYYAKFADEHAVNPRCAFHTRSKRVHRGGGWMGGGGSGVCECRSASRSATDPTAHHPNYGFRVALPAVVSGGGR